MLRSLLIRLLFFPLALLLANCIGFVLPTAAAQLGAFEQGREQPLLAVLGQAFVAYGGFLQGVLRGDLGSFDPGTGPVPVTTLLANSVVASLGLLALALALSVLFGILLGRAAVKIDPPGVSIWLTSFATVGLATPGFYAGTLILSAVALLVIYGPWPVGAFPIPVQGYGWDLHLLFPTLVLMLQPTARIAQVTASMLTGELGKQYVVAARSLGHTWPTIVNRLAFRNIVVAVIATVAGSLRILVAELVIVERLFNWPGLGQLLLTFFPALLASTLTIFAAIFLLADAVTVILARVYDPRLR
jgi:peptide/nickel transport system permease protein